MENTANIRDKIDSFLKETLKKLNCISVEELTPAKCNVPIKNDLSKCLHAALIFIEIQNKTM